MSEMHITVKKIGPLRQWSICLIMVVVAWLMCVASHTSFVGLFAAPIPLIFQSYVAASLCVAVAINTWVGYKMTAGSTTGQHMFESYNKLDLRGWNPVQIAVAAGIGEEILFRGAIQTIAGVGISSALFVVAHAKAYRFNTVDRRVVMQATGILAISLLLAVVARYAGLLPAMVLHTAIDLGGLLSVRHFASRQTLDTSAETV